MLSGALWLTGCEIPGLGPDPSIAQKEEEAKAIGGACRHGQRGIEVCYALNPNASKASIFTGWKDMDQYMRDNNIEGIPAPAVLPTPPAPPEPAPKPKPKPKRTEEE